MARPVRGDAQRAAVARAERAGRTFTVDELELGVRVAVRLHAEQDGWGAWIDSPALFGVDLTRAAPVEVHADWLPYPHG